MQVHPMLDSSRIDDPAGGCSVLLLPSSGHFHSSDIPLRIEREGKMKFKLAHLGCLAAALVREKGEGF